MSTLEILVTIYSIGVVCTFAWAISFSLSLSEQVAKMAMDDLISNQNRNGLKIAKLDDQAKRLMKFSPITSIFWPIILVLVFVVTICKNK